MTSDDVTTNSRLAGLVKRYHTWPVLTTQSVAEHSWQVYRIHYEIFGPPSQEVAYHIMSHDIGEIVSGDLPYPLKSKDPTLKNIMDSIEVVATKLMGWHPSQYMDPEDLKSIKLCHMIEMMEFGIHEMLLGNRYASPIYERCHDGSRTIAFTITNPEIRDRALRFIESGVCRLA